LTATWRVDATFTISVDDGVYGGVYVHVAVNVDVVVDD
jgi:hypothetical protein